MEFRWYTEEVQVLNVHCSAASSSLEVVIKIIQSIQMPITFILSLLKYFAMDQCRTKPTHAHTLTHKYESLR